MIQEGLFSRAMEGITGGVILAAFALALGASDLEIGLIAAIPFLAQLAHLPGVALLARFPDRRLLAVSYAAGARALFLLIAVIPFLDLPVRPLTVLIALLVLYAVLATLSGASWQVWVRELVPRDRIGAYFGRRMGILSAVGLVTLLAAGQFLTWWRDTFPGQELARFSILFALGGLLGFLSAYLLSRAPSVPGQVVPARDLGESLRRPFRERNFRRLLVFLGAWGFAANFALPFVTVVLLRTLGYSLAVVTLLAAFSQVANIVGFRLWAPLTDRYGNKPVLFVSASIFLFAMIAWALLPKVATTPVLAAIFVLHVFFGLATAGLDLASNGVVMKLASEEALPSYLASASIVKAIATGVAPLLAGLVALSLSDTAFTLRLGWARGGAETVVTAVRIAHYDFLFLTSAILGLYAIHRLLGFEEAGEAPPEEVVRAMRREVGQVSSIAGMRQFTHLSSYLVETVYRFESTLSRGMGRTRRPPPDEPPEPERS